MKKVIQVKTDDPGKKKFHLVVTGPVEKIVDILPGSVFLKGVPGDTLETVVNIIPVEKYSFSILGMEQKGNTGIHLKLIESKAGKKSWQVKIKCTSDKAQNLYDIVTLKTDSLYKPKLIIRVHAIFIEKKALKS
ncbi:MAG: hypothetical protein HOG03_09180 [Desulfobacula sp.]|jgi:hypothetical protein|nr:hypothetical protein [Desulfobacula sp.]MBT3485233.1 hypothetical protein [Desulfobacula sp.]MBT3804761.1 hypothetical protein [Desulfobacula sp.]MBT4200110.1 hypothetical protein [Desulfobacula sp.]MBT4507171.1 hypothetical protein [Desulfobacula sp.]